MNQNTAIPLTPKVRATSYSFRCGLDKKSEADLRYLKAVLGDPEWTPSNSLLIRAAIQLLADQLRKTPLLLKSKTTSKWVRSLLRRP